MSDTDSDIGLRGMVKRAKRHASLPHAERDPASDEESLYESTHQKLKKMNKE